MQSGPCASDPGAAERLGAELPSPALAARARGGAIGVKVMEGGPVESWLSEIAAGDGSCGSVAFRFGIPQGERVDTVAGPRPRTSPLPCASSDAVPGARVSAGFRVRFNSCLGRSLRLRGNALRH